MPYLVELLEFPKQVFPRGGIAPGFSREVAADDAKIPEFPARENEAQT
jgi:hypothetical protein